MRRALSDDHGEHTGAEAKELTARIAHEHPRREGVVAQEAQSPTEYCHRDDDDRLVARLVGHQHQCPDRQQADPAGETVEAIGEIQAIGDADHDQDRERKRDGERQCARREEREISYDDAAPQRHDEGGRHLSEELDAVVEIETVVQDTEDEQHRRGNEKGPQIIPRREPKQQRGGARRRRSRYRPCGV